MKILVDTCIWSLALRRSKASEKNSTIVELTTLIQDSLVQMLGAIRQEILSGIPSVEQFNKLKHYLSAFEDLTLTAEDYELAAEYNNFCRNKGVQGSNTDFLLCAISVNHGLLIFTEDKDFLHFSKHVPIQLFKPFS